MGLEENEVKYRQAQENLLHMIEGGFHKEITKLCKVMYDAFMEEGFDAPQALKLTIALVIPREPE